MKCIRVLFVFNFFAGLCTGQSLHCNLEDYKPVAGITMTAGHDSIDLTWAGEQTQELRARFALREGQPLIEELAARKADGAWTVLGKDLTADFQVTTGRRRMSTTEATILEKTQNDTPENEQRYKWNVFWDAPLAIPGTEDGHLVGPGRTPDEVKRANAAAAD